MKSLERACTVSGVEGAVSSVRFILESVLTHMEAVIQGLWEKYSCPCYWGLDETKHLYQACALMELCGNMPLVFPMLNSMKNTAR